MDYKVEGFSNLVRKSHTGAIINSDNSAYAAAKARKLERSASADRENKIDKLEHKVASMESMLKQILDKLS